MTRQLKLHERIGREDKQIINVSATVDDEDYDELSQYVWYLKIDNANDPAKRHVSVGRHPIRSDIHHAHTSLVLLNRHILHIDVSGVMVHFRDGNPLNNTKRNLILTIDGHGLKRIHEQWLRNIQIRMPR